MSLRAGISTPQLAGAVPLTPKGRLAENVVHFRAPRAAGLRVGPARTLAALEAVEAVGLDRGFPRGAGRCARLAPDEHLPVFEQAFDLFWRNPKPLEKLIALLTVFGRGGDNTPSRSFRHALLRQRPPPAATSRRRMTTNSSSMRRSRCSPREVLQRKDFETMTAEESLFGADHAAQPGPAAARAAGCGAGPPSLRGHRVDLRAT